MERKILGLTESIYVLSNGDKKKVVARIDSGATKSSIDSQLASEMKVGPIVRTRMVKSAHGNTIRPLVRVLIEICEDQVEGEFTIADRSHMKYKILIGQDILKKGKYLIDALK